MQTSEKNDQIIAAFLAAQKEFEPAVKESTNNHFGQNYADFTAVWSAVMPVLLKNDICLMQFPEHEGDLFKLTTRITHKSGQFIESIWISKPDRANIQGIGSLITYMKRYALQAICGLPSEDDDGNKAAGVQQGKQAPRQAQRQQTNPPKENILKTKFQALKTDHQNMLVSWMEKRKIDKSLFKEISIELDGKTFENLADVAKKVIESKSDAS